MHWSLTALALILLYVGHLLFSMAARKSYTQFHTLLQASCTRNNARSQHITMFLDSI